MNPDRWLVLTVGLDSPELGDLVAEELIALGGSSVVEHAGLLTTYLPAPSDPRALTESAREQLATALPEGSSFRIAWEWQQDEDWAREWKRGLRPREITPRLVVKPTWTEWDATEGQIVIAVDPQMAFGTGEHATTRGCLRLLDAAILEGDRVLDVGSGSAILAIAAAKLGAREVVAVEYDPDANINARENLAQNGVDAGVSILERMADPPLLAELGGFDLITANILSGVIRPLLPSLRSSLAEARAPRLIVSGILQTEAEEVLRSASTAGFVLEREDREDEWWSALMKLQL